MAVPLETCASIKIICFSLVERHYKNYCPLVNLNFMYADISFVVFIDWKFKTTIPSSLVGEVGGVWRKEYCNVKSYRKLDDKGEGVYEIL